MKRRIREILLGPLKWAALAIFDTYVLVALYSLSQGAWTNPDDLLFFTLWLVNFVDRKYHDRLPPLPRA